MFLLFLYFRGGVFLSFYGYYFYLIVGLEVLIMVYCGFYCLGYGDCFGVGCGGSGNYFGGGFFWNGGFGLWNYFIGEFGYYDLLYSGS